MKYEMRIKFDAQTDDDAKEIMSDTLDEVDACVGHVVTETGMLLPKQTKGQLFYEDGTEVP